jgi:hypothetical protein
MATFEGKVNILPLLLMWMFRETKLRGACKTCTIGYIRYLNVSNIAPPLITVRIANHVFWERLFYYFDYSDGISCINRLIFPILL